VWRGDDAIIAALAAASIAFSTVRRWGIGLWRIPGALASLGGPERSSVFGTYPGAVHRGEDLIVGAVPPMACPGPPAANRVSPCAPSDCVLGRMTGICASEPPASNTLPTCACLAKKRKKKPPLGPKFPGEVEMDKTTLGCRGTTDLPAPKRAPDDRLADGSNNRVPSIDGPEFRRSSARPKNKQQLFDVFGEQL